MDGVRAPYQLIQCLNGLLLNRLLLAGAQVEISDDLWILCLQYYMFVQGLLKWFSGARLFIFSEFAPPTRLIWLYITVHKNSNTLIIFGVSSVHDICTMLLAAVANSFILACLISSKQEFIHWCYESFINCLYFLWIPFNTFPKGTNSSRCLLLQEFWTVYKFFANNTKSRNQMNLEFFRNSYRIPVEILFPLMASPFVLRWMHLIVRIHQ